MNLKQRILNLLIAIDQLIYVIITLGDGCPDETMSAAAYKIERDGKFFGFFRPVIDTLLWFDQDHCRKAYLAEVSRAQLPPGYTPESQPT
jgi:hypothetical protein